METTALTPQQTFEQKLMDRIRDSIGELMSDDDLKRIIERGVEKALFSGRETGDSWNRRTEPAFIERAVDAHLKERMRVAVDAWIAANSDKMQEAVTRAMDAGVAECVMRAMDNRFSNLFPFVFEQMKARGMIQA